MKLEFNDASQFVQGSSATVLSIGATDEIDLTATLIDINGNLDVSGTVTIGNAEISEAELETIDGITAGTVIASKALVADANIDITGGRNITISGELDAATLDISGNADIDGTLEADAITINSTAIGSIYGVLAGSSSIVTVGAVNAGSITSGFTSIDVGAGAITTTGVITGGTVEATTDTAADDNAAMGYTSAEGLILTGQGSTSDITLKNDADATVFTVPTGTDDILFPDNAKAMFGASSDLQIYHNGTHSIISDQGTGDLKLYASKIEIQSPDAGENIAIFNDDGNVELYHNNAKKIETTAYGITVTGTALATTDTDTSNTGSVTLDFQTNQNFVLTMTGNVTLANPSTEQVGQSGFISCIQDGTGSRTLGLGTDYESEGGDGITLTTDANATDLIPYIVVAANRILLGTPQLKFS
jgi:cytoskeletal protein CcmA (bactofilin family)